VADPAEETMTMTTPDIYALRWKLAAALLQIDPERDPLPNLGELREAFVRENDPAAVKGEFGAFMPTGYTLEQDGRYWTWNNDGRRGAAWNKPQAALRQAWRDHASRRCTDLQEIRDLLAERMALLDRDKPGVTLIECIRGMLAETAQKPAGDAKLRDRIAALEQQVGEQEIDRRLRQKHARASGDVLSWCLVRFGGGMFTAHDVEKWSERDLDDAAISLRRHVEQEDLERAAKRSTGDTPHLSSALRLRDRAEAAEAKVKALEESRDLLQNDRDRARVTAQTLASDLSAVRKSLLAAKGFEDSTRSTAQLADDVAARLSATGDEMARQRDRATLAEAELRGPAARATEALKSLGWHGAGDPREWADAKRLEIERELAAERDRQFAALSGAKADLAAARHEASQQQQRAVKLEAGVETIAAAYYKAGFGPSPTTPAAIAAALGKARERGDALNALGWDGKGDPESWAKNEAGLREAAGSDIRAHRAKAERDAKIRGDALRVLGWDGSDHPEKWAHDRARMIAEHGAQMERANAHAARWRRACELFCWAPETEPPTMIDFSRAQALLVAPLKAALGPGFIDDSPALIVGLAVKRIERDAATWEDARRRAIDALVEPLKAATGASAAASPARLVDLAVMRIQVGDKAMDDLATVRTGAHKLDKDSAQVIAAHRWRAADLQALLDHERKLSNDRLQRLQELAGPVMSRIDVLSPDPEGVVKALVRALQNATFVERDL
jgi:AraC-like DNA-binding protein